jgi:hypothetical protein
MPEETGMEEIAKSLRFLQKEYLIELLDPLSEPENLSLERYYQHWGQKLTTYLPRFDAFWGFSFGGIILQHCFPVFSAAKKPVILCSTPSFIDESLGQKLARVITLCKEGNLSLAMDALYQTVYFPNDAPVSYSIKDPSRAMARLITGLQYVLDTDSRAILKNTDVDHLHLLGECSNLVNLANVCMPRTGKMLTVPGAGMRMLQDNPSFCEQVVWDYLRGTM